MSKQDYVDYQIKLALSESEDFDLLVMGRQEGPGCYCYINNILRTYVDNLAENYDFVVIDNEAGMEHLSRRTTKKMDLLFIVTDSSKIGIETAGRIRTLADEMELKIGKSVLVINRARDDTLVKSNEEIHKHDFDYVFAVPYDEAVEEQNNQGESLLSLPDDSKATLEVKNLLNLILE
jgi:CO dehydrogenase maturation factor